jgi:hypothetical protein
MTGPTSGDCTVSTFPKPEKGSSRRRRLSLEHSAERAARRAVRARDGARCAFPGCLRAGIHLHHIIPRSLCTADERWDPENLAFLCVDHHAAIHAKRLELARVSGLFVARSGPLAVSWLLE